jgi:DNA polymerase alpha subunit A
MIDIVFALAEQNREGFDIIRSVVGKYLDKCGRRYVNLGGIFHFMA